MPRYWLMKSEPSTYGIDDLRARPRQTDCWDGVRNYQARNMLRDEIRPGDLAFFYHSSCAEPGIVGIMKITGAGRPDPTAFEPRDHHYDPERSPTAPRWYVVEVRLERKLKRTITLTELKRYPELSGLPLLKRGNRLSVMPVEAKHWQFILSLV